MSYKPTIILDFDGVIHSYSSGWKGADVIPDPIVEGAISFMLTMLGAGWQVCIHSSRTHAPGGISAMRDYLKKESGNCWYDSPAGPGIENVEFPQHKPAALLTIDDRAITFTGVWPTLDFVKNFKPWNKT